MGAIAAWVGVPELAFAGRDLVAASNAAQSTLKLVVGALAGLPLLGAAGLYALHMPERGKVAAVCGICSMALYGLYNGILMFLHSITG
jgi:hypothetical protein